MAEVVGEGFPRQDNSLPRGRVDLGVSAPTRPVPPPPTQPRPDTVRPTPEPKPVRPKKHTARNIVLASLVAMGVVETTGAVITEQTNDQPMNAQTVKADLAWPWSLGKSAVEDIQRLLRGKSPSPEASVFDPQADRQTVQAGVNTIAVSETELKKAYQQQSAQNKDGRPTAVFPGKFTADGQKIDYTFQPPLGGATDSQTGKPVIQERPGSINLKLDKNIEIPVVAENAEVFQFKPNIIDGKEYFVGVFMKWQENGKTYGLRIAGADVRTFKPLGNVVNAPIVPANENGGLALSKAENGLRLPLGTSIARVDLSSPDVFLNFDRYNSTTDRWESIKPNFVTDNSTGQTKLMLPQ